MRFKIYMLLMRYESYHYDLRVWYLLRSLIVLLPVLYSSDLASDNDRHPGKIRELPTKAS